MYDLFCFPIPIPIPIPIPNLHFCYFLAPSHESLFPFILEILETLLQVCSVTCEFSLTIDNLFFKYCIALLHLLADLPVDDLLNLHQLRCVQYCSKLSSLLVIHSLPLLITIMNQRLQQLPPLSPSPSATLPPLLLTAAAVQQTIFSVFVEMRDINKAFEAVLSQTAFTQLSVVYTTDLVRETLETLSRQILPLQIPTVLTCLYPFILDRE